MHNSNTTPQKRRETMMTSVIISAHLVWEILLAIVLLTHGRVSDAKRFQESIPLPSPNKLNSNTIAGISCDFEEPCEWRWEERVPETGSTGFQLTTGKDVMEIRRSKPDPLYDFSGPHQDFKNDTEGKGLILSIIFNMCPSLSASIKACSRVPTSKM